MVERRAMRELVYYEAKLEGLREILAADERVHLFAESFLGLSEHRGLFREIVKDYPDRVIAPPISEIGFSEMPAWGRGAAGPLGCGNAESCATHSEPFSNSMPA